MWPKRRLALGILSLVVLAISFALILVLRGLSLSGQTQTGLMDELFINKIAPNIDLNSGITIERLKSGVALGDSPPLSNDVAFLVLNHADESIVFPDQGFGLQLFGFDTSSSSWQKIEMRTHPEVRQKVLPPRLGNYDFSVDNSWLVFADELQRTKYSSVRLYILGMGSRTGKQYGAYLDAAINP